MARHTRSASVRQKSSHSCLAKTTAPNSNSLACSRRWRGADVGVASLDPRPTRGAAGTIPPFPTAALRGTRRCFHNDHNNNNHISSNNLTHPNTSSSNNNNTNKRGMLVQITTRAIVLTACTSTKHRFRPTTLQLLPTSTGSFDTTTLHMDTTIPVSLTHIYTHGRHTFASRPDREYDGICRDQVVAQRTCGGSRNVRQYICLFGATSRT